MVQSRYVNNKHDYYVLLRVALLDEILEKAYVAAYSSLLYGQCIIKEVIYMIQKNRLKKGKKATNSRQISA
jgi:hypothetical protein